MHKQQVHRGMGSVRPESVHSHTDALISSPYSFSDSNPLLVPILQPQMTHLPMKTGTHSWWQWTTCLSRSFASTLVKTLARSQVGPRPPVLFLQIAQQGGGKWTLQWLQLEDCGCPWEQNYTLRQIGCHMLESLSLITVLYPLFFGDPINLCAHCWVLISWQAIIICKLPLSLSICRIHDGSTCIFTLELECEVWSNVSYAAICMIGRWRMPSTIFWI